MCEQAKRLLAWHLSASLPGAMAATLPWTTSHMLSSPHLISHHKRLLIGANCTSFSP